MTFPFDSVGLEEPPALRDLREREGIRKVALKTGGEAWLVTRYADVRQVESDPRFSRAAATKPGTPTVWPDFQVQQGLLYLDPPDHSRVRKVIAAVFSPRRIELLAPKVQQFVDELLDELRPGDDFFAKFAYPLPLKVIAEVLGMPPTDRQRFQGWMNVLLDSAQPPEAIGRAFGGVYSYLAQLIETKQPGDDALTALLESGELRGQELLHNVQSLIFAGADTTAGMLANGLITLLRHPDQLSLLRKEPQLIKSAVEELLRFVPTLVASPARVATVDVEIGGTVIPKGDSVLTIERSANHDAAAFDSPERLDITRNPVHLAFGHGPHFCIGAAIARLQLTTALGTLINKFPGLRLADEQLEWLPNRILFTVRELRLRW
ncbi:cytochrome P450 [Lentzea sp. NBRC 105346]|uniref:cytochrome P450 n=1 Tax=Lentzea sp. NBRC 105346 TaxID=3032205 RepID=UPI0024A11BC5|nr:cytochrome P450 [Lentzea sp. NBRC 105346]GLZ32513.1 cytochrome P450 [Lentzea sp. NBRC 105346]